MELHEMVDNELCEFFYRDTESWNVTAPITETVEFIRDVSSEEDDTFSMLKGFLIGLSAYESISHSDMVNTLRIVKECIEKIRDIG